jgi:hypothetical protein
LLALGWRQVRGGLTHRRAMRRGVTDDDQTAVVWNIQPFVSVGRPGVRLLDAGDQLAQTRRRRGPETERAVDVQPCTPLTNELTDRREGIAGARVDVASLGADDRRSRRRGEGPFQRVRTYAALRVGRDTNNGFAADAYQAARGGN